MQFSTASPASEQKANKAFYKVMQSAPMGLLISAGLGLAIVGIFQFLFYDQVLPSTWNSLLRCIINAALALFFEGLGFYFLVATVRDFSANARKEGLIGLIATVLLWVYSLWEATHISAAFDDNTPSGYYSILGIIGTIVCVVRVVELRITLTVTSSVKHTQQENEFRQQLDTYRKELDTTTGKLRVFEAEKERAIEAEKRQQERARAMEQENARLQQERERAQYLEAQEEIERLRRRLEKSAAKGPAVSNTGREAMERKAREFFNRNNIPPTQQQVAEMCGLRDAKSVRLQFPNGSWDAFILSLSQEDTTPETSTTNLVNS